MGTGIGVGLGIDFGEEEVVVVDSIPAEARLVSSGGEERVVASGGEVRVYG